jgi:hypothetical protein
MVRPLRHAAVLVAAALLAACPSKKECPAGQTDCGGNCLDLQSNPTSCGMCGLACASGASCAGGTCACPGGQIPCPAPGGTGSVCVDPATDAENCGPATPDLAACGQRCGAGSCILGSCFCDAGAGHCDSDLWPWCVDFATDVEHCGDCATACTRVHEACIPTGGSPPGACGCAEPWPDDCGGSCVDMDSDPSNCGGCGPAFACTLEGTTCTGGSCVCASGLLDCGAAGCFDLDTDERHCGTCLASCAATETCCLGSCTDLANDESNCGSCDHACLATETCSSGVCCPTGAVVCGTSCCAGTGCCGTACQTEHSNGLGQHFYDCDPLGTYDASSAAAAAQAWNSSVSTVPIVCAASDCLRSQTDTACPVWCYSGSLGGRVALNTTGNSCVCPSTGTPNWN